MNEVITKSVTTPIDPATDTRNVADQFKGMTDDAIRLEMQKIRTPMVSIAMNMTHDFNKGSALRAHNSFAGQEFIFVNKVNDQDPENPDGVKRWDKRGAVGSYNYSSVKHTVDWETLFANLRADGYRIYAVDNSAGYDPHPIYNTVMPEKSAFVYGEEGPGIPNEIIDACDEMIYIPQFGTVRSLNVAQAAAVVMYEYSRQHMPQL